VRIDESSAWTVDRSASSRAQIGLTSFTGFIVRECDRSGPDWEEGT
jgi:hypothetical protein